VADTPDVETALVATIASALYPPNGSATAGQASAAGPVCKVYRGWPVPASLDSDLASGIVNISIFTDGNEKNTSRALLEWKQLTAASPLITLSVNQNAVTVGGSIQAGDFAAVKVGTQNVFSVASSGSTSAVAAALAAAIAVKFPGTAAVGNVVTIPTSQTVLVAAGGNGTAWMELRRQMVTFQITVWCPTPASRDIIGPFIKLLFANIERLVLVDSSFAWIYFGRSIITDKNQTQQSYRRDFYYNVEFPTTQIQTFPSIGAFAVSTTGGVSPADTPAPVVTVV
jgi:hypothetical protein